MIKAVIIDDEPSAVRTMELMLQRYLPAVTDYRSCTDPEEALTLIRNYQPQLVFLDIQMPAMNGFELLKQIPWVNFHIIFTTAYDQYAIQAIRFSALDYLLKPIDAGELVQAFERFQHFSRQKEMLYKNLLDNLSGDQPVFRLALNTLEGVFFYYPSEILRMEGESNYTRFFFTNNKKLVVSKTLKEYEDLLEPHGFIRVHKSHMVNLKYVTAFTPDGFVSMKDGSKVEVSRRRKDKLLEALRS